jgi:hypothetical protein
MMSWSLTLVRLPSIDTLVYAHSLLLFLCLVKGY